MLIGLAIGILICVGLALVGVVWLVSKINR